MKVVPNEPRRKFIIQIHANLVFLACISFLCVCVCVFFRGGGGRNFIEMLAVSYLVLQQVCISLLRCFRHEWRISVFALFI